MNSTFLRSVNDVVGQRLANQKLAGSALRAARDVVSWFGAVQAQDFPGARWAIGVRSKGLTDADVERAYNEGAILRTHVLRPTWHFVTAEDIRWLIALSGPRVIARMAYRHRQLELDARTVARSRAAIVRALESNNDLTRREIAAVLQRARIPLTPERLTHLVLFAELEGIVCSGPLRDRHITYTLLDRRAVNTAPVEEEEGLGRLAERYFASHGPATVGDFSWWSGLTTRDARRALEIAGIGLSRDAVLPAGPSRSRPRTRRSGASAWLLPNFDEYLVAYRDRTAMFAGSDVDPRNQLTHSLVIDGLVAGTWRRAQRNGSVGVALTVWRRLGDSDIDSIRRAARCYGAFLGRAVEIVD